MRTIMHKGLWSILINIKKIDTMKWMKRSVLGFVGICACLAMACTAEHGEVSPSAANANTAEGKHIEATASRSCQPTYGSPRVQCTGGVRELLGGCSYWHNGQEHIGDGVPWSGHASAWWNKAKNHSDWKTSSTPAMGDIVVYPATSTNLHYGHVGLVVATYPVVIVKSRNWDGNATLDWFIRASSSYHVAPTGYIRRK